MSSDLNKCISAFKKKYPERNISYIGKIGGIYILSTYTNNMTSDDGFYKYNIHNEKISEYPYLLYIKEFKSALKNIVYKE